VAVAVKLHPDAVRIVNKAAVEHKPFPVLDKPFPGASRVPLRIVRAWSRPRKPVPLRIVRETPGPRTGRPLTPHPTQRSP